MQFDASRRRRSRTESGFDHLAVGTAHLSVARVTFRGFVDMQLCVCVSVVSTDALTGRNSRAVTAHASLRSRIVTPGPAAVARFQRRSYMHEIQRTGVANL